MVDHSALLLLVTCGALAGCSAGTATPAVDTGARIYAGSCAACHQEDARGIPGVYPSLVGSPVVLGEPGALALWVVKGIRPASMASGRYPTAMVRFGWMNAPDAAALLTYLRSSHGNAAPAVEPALVAQALASQP
jgi:mono/diheme cytochrome c family protein